MCLVHYRSHFYSLSRCILFYCTPSSVYQYDRYLVKVDFFPKDIISSNIVNVIHRQRANKDLKDVIVEEFRQGRQY